MPNDLRNLKTKSTIVLYYPLTPTWNMVKNITTQVLLRLPFLNLKALTVLLDLATDCPQAKSRNLMTHY